MTRLTIVNTDPKYGTKIGGEIHGDSFATELVQLFLDLSVAFGYSRECIIDCMEEIANERQLEKANDNQD